MLPGLQQGCASTLATKITILILDPNTGEIGLSVCVEGRPTTNPPTQIPASTPIYRDDDVVRDDDFAVLPPASTPIKSR